jgi:hypothetical protein
LVDTNGFRQHFLSSYKVMCTEVSAVFIFCLGSCRGGGIHAKSKGKQYIISTRQILPQGPEPVSVDLLKSPGIDSQPGVPVRQTFLSYRGPPGYIGCRNRFLGSINVYKYGLRPVCLLPHNKSSFAKDRNQFSPTETRVPAKFICKIASNMGNYE